MISIQSLRKQEQLQELAEQEAARRREERQRQAEDARRKQSRGKKLTFEFDFEIEQEIMTLSTKQGVLKFARFLYDA